MPVMPPPPRRAVAARERIRTRLAILVMRERIGGQGRHIDPEDPSTPPPSMADWSKSRRTAEESTGMRLFADALRPPHGGSVRDGVIDDLATYYDVVPDHVVDRCLRWEDESVAEWRASAGGSPEGLAAFYNSVTSWSFDLLWYGYLQTAGFAYPKHVVVANLLARPTTGARLLDFGSGVGVTAQLFSALGYEVTLADVSKPLLSFAQWRLERRGVAASYQLLPAELPAASFDLITALDTVAHVPDARRTAGDLYRATRPGGYLAANFDVRRRSERNAWHLYEDDLPLRWAIERSGYVPIKHVDGDLWIYQARPTTGARWRLRKASAWLRLASPPARAVRAVRRALARAALVTLSRRRGRPE
jgi:2-polyprenyl-3-methyl-5-hydroxy-6-metoxy-1,4-benzoquinol methylase